MEYRLFKLAEYLLGWMGYYGVIGGSTGRPLNWTMAPSPGADVLLKTVALLSRQCA